MLLFVVHESPTRSKFKKTTICQYVAVGVLDWVVFFLDCLTCCLNSLVKVEAWTPPRNRPSRKYRIQTSKQVVNLRFQIDEDSEEEEENYKGLFSCEY
jgi:hypothetical protein